MTTTRIARTASLLAVVLWAAKATAIALAGGLGKTPLESVFFFAGLVAALVAGVALALSYVGGRGPLLRAGAAIAGALALLAVAGVVSALVELLKTSDHWAWGEVNLWVSALLALGLAWGTSPRSPHASEADEPRVQTPATRSAYGRSSGRPG